MIREIRKLFQKQYGVRIQTKTARSTLLSLHILERLQALVPRISLNPLCIVCC